MLRKIFKWTGIIILVLVAGVTIVTATRQHLTFDAPYPNIKASKDSALIAKGKHLVMGPAHCLDCHTSVAHPDSLIKLGKEVPLTGGHLFDLPFGKFYTPNLTSDTLTGIGGLSDAEIARALRYGVKRNGEAMLGFMATQNMSDEDLTAVVSYLRTLEPVRKAVPEHEYNVMGKVLKAFMIKPNGPMEAVKRNMPEDSTAEYGRHLVMAIANCNGCHTRRDDVGNYIGKHLAGGGEIEGVKVPNITPDPTGRISTWSEAAFVNRFRIGRVHPTSHMPWESFSRMNDTELKAIYRYLQTVTPVKSGEELKK